MPALRARGDRVILADPMPPDDVRARIAEHLSATEDESLPTSSLGRAGWIAGLARAGAGSIGRSVRRMVGRDDGNVAPETEVKASFGHFKGPS